MGSAKNIVANLLQGTDVQLNGDRPWDIQVRNEKLFNRVLAYGSLGFGEAYMDGWWDCEAMDEMLVRIFRVGIEGKIRNWRTGIATARARLLNAGHTSKAFEIGERHYDIGNDLYEAMLDKRLTYTCGYWKVAQNLDEAQEHKLDLTCRKIGLKPGMRILDIGCGWGSFVRFAAERYGVEAVGVTVSKEQIALAQKHCKGLPVEIRLQDYRDLTGSFDRIVSLGMFEHVGVKNYRVFMDVVYRVLKDKGLFLLHTIGGNRSVHSTDPWIEKYIFPNSMLPSIAQIGRAIEPYFVMEDWQNFGPDYDKTLMAWYANVERAWPELQKKYSERFHRMWRFYLLSCAATFRARKNQLWQVVLSKGDIASYLPIR